MSIGFDEAEKIAEPFFKKNKHLLGYISALIGAFSLGRMTVSNSIPNDNMQRQEETIILAKEIGKLDRDRQNLTIDKTLLERRVDFLLGQINHYKEERTLSEKILFSERERNSNLQNKLLEQNGIILNLKLENSRLKNLPPKVIIDRKEVEKLEAKIEYLERKLSPKLNTEINTSTLTEAQRRFYENRRPFPLRTGKMWRSGNQ